MKRRTLLQATAGSALLPALAHAQDKNPSKPVIWVCPYAAGGNADSRSRQVAKAMSALLGQPIVVDNKAGAGGNIGTEAIARGKPDGYTLGMGNFAPLAVNQTLFKKLNFLFFTTEQSHGMTEPLRSINELPHGITESPHGRTEPPHGRTNPPHGITEPPHGIT